MRRLLGALAPGLSVKQAAESLAALTDTQYAVLLMDHYGWSLSRVEQWMGDACRRLILDARDP